MRILFVFTLFGLSFALPEILEKLLGRSKGSRLGKLSANEKEELEKEWGFSPEDRKERLKNLRNRVKTIVTSKQKEKFMHRKSKLPAVSIEKPPENATLDLFDVNMAAGIAEYLYQGDIHLTDEQLDDLENDASNITRSKRQVSSTAARWTDNTVYYNMDPSLNARKQASISAALTYIQARTCIKFVYSTTARNRIRVYNGKGCNSAIGMTGGVQLLSLGDGCEVIGTVAHEFTHALGVWHMQMRSDRNSYVTIDTSDVPQIYDGNFDLLSPRQMIAYTPYEYGSFMHYGANAFIQATVISYRLPIKYCLFTPSRIICNRGITRLP